MFLHVSPVLSLKLTCIICFLMVTNIHDLMAGITPAEKLLELYHGKWGQSIDPVFEELLY